MFGGQLASTIFPKAINIDLLNLNHLSHSFRIIPSAEPLKKDDVVETQTQIHTVLIQAAGRWWGSEELARGIDSQLSSLFHNCSDSSTIPPHESLSLRGQKGSPVLLRSYCPPFFFFVKFFNCLRAQAAIVPVTQRIIICVLSTRRIPETGNLTEVWCFRCNLRVLEQPKWGEILWGLA